MLPILLLDPDLDAAATVDAALRRLEPDVLPHHVSTLRSATAAIAAHSFGCIVTELRLPDGGGPDIIRRLRELQPQVPIVVWTTGVEDEAAAAAIRLGAREYRRKDSTSAVQLVPVVRAAVGGATLERFAEYADLPAARCADADPIISTTAAMRRTLGMIDRAAASDVPVLLEGETGTGKELLARAVHERGARRREPFLAQNCAAISETLLESELFGHVRGAFTGADRDRPGLFVEAARGTVVLDEIGEAPPPVQAKLLRVLQEGEVKAVGADRPTVVRARIIAATNRSLDAEVQRGRFRSDLYFRLAVFPIHVPPLRHRAADVPALAERFRLRAETLEHRGTGGFAVETLQALTRYAWPGNVRELEHEVHRLVLTVDAAQRILPRHLAVRIRQAAPPSDEPLARILERIELALLQDRLDRLGSKTAAAKSLGITREALYAKLRRHLPG